MILIDSALDIAREYDRLYAESEAARQAAEAREQDYRQQLHERSSDAATTGAKLATANIKLQAAEARVTELEEAIRPIVAVTSTAFSHSNAKLCPHGNDARYPTHARWCDECWDKLAVALTPRALADTTPCPPEERVAVQQQRVDLALIYIERLRNAGNDVAAALVASMETDEPFGDVEAVEHCNAQVERWVELVQPRALTAEPTQEQKS
ncbi:MAG TPA: hypothetical protein VF981_07435 [Gemmatimonadaceae bacterium]